MMRSTGIFGNEKKYVFVYLDEIYVNQNHSIGKSRRSGRGKRLIILYAITKDGPLAERDPETGKPIPCQLKWSGDTPHSISNCNCSDEWILTTEMFWVSNSRIGDYHDNMNSENCIRHHGSHS